MAGCRRGCQSSLVALALYPRECQSRTVVRAGRAVKRPAGKPQARTLVTGSAESAPTSSGDGLASRATSSAPRAATMAPLSVHRPGRGTRSRMPGRLAALRGQRAQPGVGRHAAADDQVVHAVGPAGLHRLAGQHVRHRLLEGGRDVRHGHAGPGRAPLLHPAGHRGLQARRRRSRGSGPGTWPGGRRSRRGHRTGPPGRSAGRRGTAARAPGPPCRRPHRRRRRWWPRAAARRRRCPGPAAARSDRRTPAARWRARAARRAPAGPRRCARPGGSPRTAACPGPARRPWPRTRPPAARRSAPGPAVTAIASTSASVTPAVASARSTAGTMASRCARLATSGTTPPKRACSATLEATESASSSCPRTSPAPVSSQDVSMPRTRGARGAVIGCLLPPACCRPVWGRRISGRRISGRRNRTAGAGAG